MLFLRHETCLLNLDLLRQDFVSNHIHRYPFIPVEKTILKLVESIMEFNVIILYWQAGEISIYLRVSVPGASGFLDVK